jgi:hypothetical protein
VAGKRGGAVVGSHAGRHGLTPKPGAGACACGRGLGRPRPR